MPNFNHLKVGHIIHNYVLWSIQYLPHKHIHLLHEYQRRIDVSTSHTTNILLLCAPILSVFRSILTYTKWTTDLHCLKDFEKDEKGSFEVTCSSLLPGNMDAVYPSLLANWHRVMAPYSHFCWFEKRQTLSGLTAYETMLHLLFVSMESLVLHESPNFNIFNQIIPISKFFTSLAVITTFACASLIRWRNDSALNPANTTLWIAPIPKRYKSILIFDHSKKIELKEVAPLKKLS